MKKDKFQPTNEFFGKKLSMWNEKHMSMAAKGTLIKSVAQALINYIMSIFKLPAGFHDDYMKTIRKFWWEEDEDQRKVHLTSWDNLRLPKVQGGVVFRDTQQDKPGESSKIQAAYVPGF
jgi:hypothetical protein